MSNLEKQLAPSNEQTREFWEWCGFKLRCPPDKDAYGRGIWDYPNGLYGDLELDLNNLFKFAVPKLEGIDAIEFVLPENKSQGFDCNLKKSPKTDDYFGSAKDPALALFWAIWEVIKK